MTPDQLRELRMSHGLTQSALAVHLGVTATTVARWERGEVPITLRSLRLVELAFEVLDLQAERQLHQQRRP